MRRYRPLGLLLQLDGELGWLTCRSQAASLGCGSRAASGETGKGQRREPQFDPRMLAADKARLKGLHWPVRASPASCQGQGVHVPGSPEQTSHSALQVLRFRPDGSHTSEHASPQQLGLGPRDVSLFVAGTKASSTQRATITPRPGCILLRTEMVRAIVRQTQAVVFPSR